jgi:hypothetical protein
MKTVLISAGLLWLAGIVTAQQAPNPSSAESLQAKINALKVPRVAWREIAWQSCLLEGLKESRAQNKPALLWIFIDRPIDDARC